MNKFWCSRNQIVKALKAEGFGYDEGRKEFFLEGVGIYMYTKDLIAFLETNAPAREDLPRVLLQEELGIKEFHPRPWELGAKPVLCRLLQGGPV